jgi:hypothetical protein
MWSMARVLRAEQEKVLDLRQLVIVSLSTDRIYNQGHSHPADLNL